MKHITTLLIALLLTITGCTTTGQFDLGKSATTAINFKYLDSLFPQTLASIRALPLDEDERMAVEQAIPVLQIEREFLRTLHERNAGEIVLSGLQAQTHIDDMTEAYRLGYSALASYYSRTKGQEPPAQLLLYDKTARQAKDAAQEAIDSGAGLSGVQLTQYLGLAVKTLAVMNGVPVI